LFLRWDVVALLTGPLKTIRGRRLAGNLAPRNRREARRQTRSTLEDLGLTNLEEQIQPEAPNRWKTPAGQAQAASLLEATRLMEALCPADHRLAAARLADPALEERLRSLR